MNRISKKLALFCAVLLINPLVSTAKPGFAAQNNGDRVSEYVKEADKKLNSADTEAKKNEDKPKELRLIIELDKDSLIEEAINKDMDYDKLDDSFIDEKKQELKEDQDKLVKDIKNEDIKADVKEVRHYDTVFNGISLSAEATEIEKIEALPGVKSVYVSQEFQRPYLKSSNSITGSGYAWNTLGYKGEGSVIAIIDSGIDYRHKALRLDESVHPMYTKTDIEKIIAENGLKGSYYSDKVPYGYNYYDFNKNLRNSYGVMHGMHVSGIAAANDIESGTFGVAPNAQILALKVFSDDLEYPTTFTDIWLKALDDAITLKADVINLSLGTAAGFSMENRAYPENEVIEKARKAGIVISVAAGNDGNITSGNINNVEPLKENYDTALIANPAVNEGTIAVASMENTKRHMYVIRWKDSWDAYVNEEMDLHKGENPKKIISADIFDLKNAKQELIKKENIEGKLVLFEIPTTRDSLGFGDKLETIAELKPAAIVFYNNRSMAEQIGGNLEVPGNAGKLTCIRIKRSTYDKLMEEYGYNNNLRPEIFTEMTDVDNVAAGSVSKFSSWGPTPDLRIKPEITAPGGHIYSSVEDDKYKDMSGTSMAAPQVTGATAILKQYIKAKNIQTDNSSEFIKLLLMNTATPLKDEGIFEDIPYFVRQQGSGALNIENALKTTVVVRAQGTNDNIADGKLELKELKDKRFDVRLSLENFGDSTKSYDINSIALYEPTDGTYRLQRSEILHSNESNISREISVEAHSSASIDFTMDYSDAENLDEDNFIEGFISLKDKDGISDLNIPFLGFYGDWGRQRAIDAFQLPEIGSEKRNVQFFVNKNAGVSSSMLGTSMMLKLPLYNDEIYFSPNSKYYSDVAARIAPLRNMEQIEYSILDAKTEETLRVLGISKQVRKLSRLSVNKSFKFMPESVWDGKLGEGIAENGVRYIYCIKAKLNTNNVGGSGEQVYKFPIRVDSMDPNLSTANEVQVKDIDGNMKEIVFNFHDKGIGIENVYLQSIRYAQDDKADTSIRYGKSFVIRFQDEPIKDGKELVKVEDGKLNIPLEAVPDSPTARGEAYVYTNGYRNSDIEVHCPYFADTSDLIIDAVDYMDNKSRTTLSDVREGNYNQINFLNFFDYISNKNASVYVNDIKLDDMTYSLIEKEAVIRIKLADEESHLHKLTLKHDNIEENIILDNKVNSEISKKYSFKYDEDKLCYEFTINPIETSFDITTVFRDGKPMQNTHESTEEAGFTDITINNATASNAEKKPYPAVFLKTPEFFDVLG
ncbi:MAG: S8 family serine peptidase, partial [Lachnoanaerobaculum sp.]|nr:S8 family serine peptidase [Lachnoanaerobaculum sp.]